MGLYIDLYALYENDPDNYDSSSGRHWIESGSYIEETSVEVPSAFNGIADRVTALHYHITGNAFKHASAGWLKFSNMVISYNDTTLEEPFDETESTYLREYINAWLTDVDTFIPKTNYPTGYVTFTGSGNYETTYTLDITIPASEWFIDRYSNDNAYQEYIDTGNAHSHGRMRYFTRLHDKTTKTPVDTLLINKLSIRLEFYKANVYTSEQYLTLTGNVNIPAYPYSTPPSISAFAMNRADEHENISQQGTYGRYDITSNLAAILASDEPQFIKDNTALTLSFTRNGSTISHAAAAGGTGLLQSGGAALELGNEETFTVTATLTDGINTMSMSEPLSANFAIFNCNSAKNSVGIGKYCDGTFTGLDVNMNAKFRNDVTIVGELNLETSPIEVLWVNPSPSSSISGSKTMSRAVENGELMLCGFKYNTGSTIAAWHNFCFVGVDTMTLFAGNASNNRNGTRALTFTAGSSSVTVGSCTFNDNTHNDYLVPVYIATIKGFKLTSAMLSNWSES